LVQRFVHPGYRFIFSSEDTSIAFFQLLLNVGFAALLGAILATIIPKITKAARKIPKWVWYVTGGCITIAALTVGIFALAQAKFRRTGVAQAEPQSLAPAIPKTKHYPWKTNIVTTVFWIGGPKETDMVSVRTGECLGS
jgi:hypothetical protein